MPQPRTAKRITLGDLSSEARKALLEEAREAAKHNPTDVAGYAELTERERAIRDLMDARDHSRGCPVQEGTELGRVEGMDAYRPGDPNTGRPPATIAVIRCVECGGSSVLDTPPTDLETALARELEAVPAGAAGEDDETL